MIQYYIPVIVKGLLLLKTMAKLPFPPMGTSWALDQHSAVKCKCRKIPKGIITICKHFLLLKAQNTITDKYIRPLNVVLKTGSPSCMYY